MIAVPVQVRLYSTVTAHSRKVFVSHLFPSLSTFVQLPLHSASYSGTVVRFLPSPLFLFFFTHCSHHLFTGSHSRTFFLPFSWSHKASGFGIGFSVPSHKRDKSLCVSSLSSPFSQRSLINSPSSQLFLYWTHVRIEPIPTSSQPSTPFKHASSTRSVIFSACYLTLYLMPSHRYFKLVLESLLGVDCV